MWKLSIQIVCKVNRLDFCCAAALPRTTAPLALKELLSSTFFKKVIILACMSCSPLHQSNAGYLEIWLLLPSTWQGQFVPACARVVFCASGATCAGAPKTTYALKHSSTITRPPWLLSLQGGWNRFPLSGIRLSSAWNIHSVELQARLYLLWVRVGMTVKLNCVDFVGVRILAYKSWFVLGFWPLAIFKFDLLWFLFPDLTMCFWLLKGVR